MPKTIINCKKFKKTKDPKCNDQTGCEWTVGKGCLKDDEEDKDKDIKKITKLKIDKPKTINCKKFKKTKDPKCNDQEVCEWTVGKGCMDIRIQDSKKESIPLKSIKSKSEKKEIKGNLDLFTQFLDIIHSISGICDYGRIDLKSGPILLNMGDLHTWTNRGEIETAEKWEQFCDSNNNMEKKLIRYKEFDGLKYSFFEIDDRKTQVLNLNLPRILKNNEIFISHFILYILKNFTNVHLFLESYSDKRYTGYGGRHATPQWYNRSLWDISRNKPQFMKDNNNFIHYNDFRDDYYIFYNLFKYLRDSKFKYGDSKALRKNITTKLSKNEYINLIKKIYVQVFLQGFKFSNANIKWKKEVNSYMIYDNKKIKLILRQMDTHIPDIISLMNKVGKVSSSDKDHTIRINGNIIHCTKLSKQLLKLKPKIQEKVVKWFYDLIISKLNHILYFNLDELKISYIFWIMFIDFYNLCRILYYTGFGNSDIDMSKNIILNYGGENMYLDKPSKYAYFNILDNNTGGHASSVLLFYRKYLYGNGSGNSYVEKPTNNSIGQKRHYSFKNDHIEIKKYLSRYIENRTEGRDCVEIQ